MHAQAPALNVHALLAGMDAMHLSGVSILRGEGLDGESLPASDALAPDALFDRLLLAGLRDTGRATFPLEVGMAVPQGAFGMLDYLASSSDTLGGALLSLENYYALASPSVRPTVEHDEQSVRVRFVTNRGATSTEMTRRAFGIGVYVGRFRAVLPEPDLMTAVYLQDAAPVEATAYQSLLKAPVIFSSPLAGIDFRAEGWTAPISTADPALRVVLTSLAEQLGLGKNIHELEFAIRARLRDALPLKSFAIDDIAAALGTSVRTLQRRLAGIQLNFQDVVDDFRRVECLKLLDANTVTLIEIADRLGYSEQASFNRAFKRWTERTPLDWVAQRRSAA